MSPQQQPKPKQHSQVVLFYKYFIGHSLTIQDAEALQEHQREVCARLQLKGRILLATEGINGTVSALDGPTLEAYMGEMEEYMYNGIPLYSGIDWKRSDNNGQTSIEPFPELKISLVQEIVSTGGTVPVEDLPLYTGTHLTPRQFHAALDEADVVIDVRNTFEYDVGHFERATNPEMVTFSSFGQFCHRHAPEWRDKRVLMYCTGGIRCEKASAMLKRCGVQNVGQLRGGIHRYLEEFGANGKFKGKNFVFDQRVAMVPDGEHVAVVGKCLECHQPYDELCGSRTCTVCRDLVLVCPTCQTKLREYHCRKHQPWKDIYFSFLEIFNLDQLQEQRKLLEQHRNDLLEAKQQQTKRKRTLQKQQNANGKSNNETSTPLHPVSIPDPPPIINAKNTRRTLLRQMEKIDRRIQQLESGQAVVEPDAPRRCRTCCEPLTICDGRCWGFWKTVHDSSNHSVPAAVGIQVGDQVEPGDHWKTSRLGSKYTGEGVLRRGTVAQVKTWAGREPNDCVAVLWDDGPKSRSRNQSEIAQPQIYRWGLLAVDGKTRLYDVQRVTVN